MVTNEINNPADDIYITDTDAKSADKYTLANIDYFKVVDAGGNDKYNISFSYGQIQDNGIGNDTYKISNMWQREYMSIFDQGGKKDSLIISDSTVDNLVFMADLKQNGEYNSQDLLVYNIERDSYIIIENFFLGDAYDIDGFGDGRIETIKAGKKTIKYNESICDFFNTVKSDMTSWLDDNGGVMTVLNGNNEAAKEQLIAYFGN